MSPSRSLSKTAYWCGAIAVGTTAPAVAARAFDTAASSEPAAAAASHSLARCAAALVRADRSSVARGELPGTRDMTRALVHLAHAYDYVTAATAIEAMAELLSAARAEPQAHLALLPALLARARLQPSRSPPADEMDPPPLGYPDDDDSDDDDDPRCRAAGCAPRDF